MTVARPIPLRASRRVAVGLGQRFSEGSASGRAAMGEERATGRAMSAAGSRGVAFDERPVLGPNLDQPARIAGRA